MGRSGGGGNLGCALIPGGFLLLGLGLVAAGYFAGDVTAFNRSTGQHSSVDTTLYIIGAVFGSIGVAGLAILVLGRER